MRCTHFFPVLVALGLMACIAPHERREAGAGGDAGADSTTDAARDADASTTDARSGRDAADADADAQELPCEQPTRYYRDRDGDGKGDPREFEFACTPREGFVGNDKDSQPLCVDDDGDDCREDATRCTPGGHPRERQRCVADAVGCTRWQPAESCERAAPRCDPTDGATCKSCTTASDCAGFMETRVCHPEGGHCVQCTGQEKEACMVDGTQYVCDPTTAACDLEREVQSKSLCETCISNDECQDGQACADVEAGAGETVCMRRATDTGDNCERPYFDDKNVPTADGDMTRVCTFRVETTCQAHDDYSDKDCAVDGSPDDDLCGAEGVDDGFCVPFGGEFRCTVRCGSVDDCPLIDGIDNACEEAQGNLRLCTLSSPD